MGEILKNTPENSAERLHCVCVCDMEGKWVEAKQTRICLKCQLKVLSIIKAIYASWHSDEFQQLICCTFPFFLSVLKLLKMNLVVQILCKNFYMDFIHHLHKYNIEEYSIQMCNPSTYSLKWYSFQECYVK